MLKLYNFSADEMIKLSENPEMLIFPAPKKSPQLIATRSVGQDGAVNDTLGRSQP